jgi:DNA-binding NarL/FixJ family response regulator
VTTVPGPDAFLTVRPVSTVAARAAGPVHLTSHPQRLARRTLVPLVLDHDIRDEVRRPDRVPMPNGLALTARSIPVEQSTRILVVDLDADLDDRLRPALQGVLAVIRTAGAFPLVSVADDDKAVVADMVLTEADAVLLALHAELQKCSRINTTAWESAARITRALSLEDHHVIALAVGASAAAVAACVENGALGVLDIDALPEAILALTKSLNGSANGEDPGRGLGARNGHRAHRTLPAPYDALVRLTSSERKVLFQMMEGRSAGDIATALMVSLSTVRSHIRAILRKLNVNSQLAAVAVANGVRFDLTPPA